MNEKLVSIIIPSYGRPKGLKRAIESVLSQTYQFIELVVVDDNNPSTNERKETEKIMKEYLLNKNIKYIQHPKNLNGSAARNTGVKNSTGSFLTFLDNDDEYLENKVKNQVNALLEKGDEYGVIYSKFIRKRKNNLIDRGIENREGCLTNIILKGEFFISAGSNIMVRRELFEVVEGFNEKFLRRQDLEFLLKVSRYTKIAAVDSYDLIIYKDDRSNQNNMTLEKLEDNKNEFLNQFREYIDSMPENEKRIVLLAQELPIMRRLLETKKLLSFFAYKKKINMKNTTLLRYFFYLLKRKIFKQCYGFKF